MEYLCYNLEVIFHGRIWVGFDYRFSLKKRRTKIQKCALTQPHWFVYRLYLIGMFQSAIESASTNTYVSADSRASDTQHDAKVYTIFH